ncbi:uncharacterized protein LOC121004842 isoform X1 [Bufo bufo]|uniref:uncharacterized protein LOC121004842 isoform X1 n=2 Tax=Bufo bufo TaxID=8384 RepID=UPI001ABEB056|nr:uncharacterized protein LOC121004842 isoform X1 [Bufo bufo]
MPHCIVLGCPHKCGEKDKFPGVIMHSFPRSLDRIKAWLLQTGQMFEDLDGLAQRIYDGKKTNAHRLCSAHFTIDCYIVNTFNKVLRPNALPTIFPPPGFYHGRKRARKQRKTKDSGQLSSSLHHSLWQKSSEREAWTEREYFFQGAETQTDRSCFDARDRPRYDRSVSDKGLQQLLRECSRLFEHSMLDAPQSLLAGLKEEQVQYPCAEREYKFPPKPQENPRFLRAIKTENVDEHPVNEHEDAIRRVEIDSPMEEVSHLMFPGLEDKINSRCLLKAEEMPKCVVKGCPHFSGRKKSTPGVTLHMFPKDLTTIKKWLLQTKQDFGDLDFFALGILQGTLGILRICSAHFAPECYALVESQKVLLEGAIPTIFSERDKPPKKKKALVTPVCPNLYKPRSVAANSASMVMNITPWGVNQLVIPVNKMNQDNNMVTNDCGVKSDMSAAKYKPKVWHSNPGTQPTDVGSCLRPMDLPDVTLREQRSTITETSPMLPQWSSEKEDRADQWPVYENNVGDESWKVTHDHFYSAPHSDKYQDPQRCSPTTAYIESDGLGSYFEDTHSESELFAMLQNVANIFTINKNKNLRSKRILNQALEIISLIAGEEWVIVNKNSIHQGVHQLTGEFPVKCDDVAVYFTVDEWSYIDQHKDDYADFVTDNIPMNRTWEVPKYWDSDPMTEDDDIENIPNEVTSSDWEPGSECGSESEKEIDEEPSKSPERPYKCEKCEEAFLDTESLETHKITHVETCEDCEEQFSSKAELIKHRAENHAVKRYACTICGIQYDYKSQFVIHQRAHTGEKPFECEECGVKFGYKSSLLVHQRRHTEGKTFECSKCDKRFDKRSEMIKHEKIHTKTKQYKCQKCGKTFVHKGRYDKHKSSDKECEMANCDEIYYRKKYKCRKCEKRFVLKWAYEKHKWTHDGED